MLSFLPDALTPALIAGAGLIALFAGLIKGALGFAMPMIMISGLGSLMPVELALAGLILPTLVTNFSQALRQGLPAAWGSVLAHWRMLLALVICLLASAQLVPFVSEPVLLAVLGGPICAFALSQLAGWKMAMPVARRRHGQWISGTVGGLYGGLSGVWGPPIMAYLIAVDTAKRDMVRILGVVFLIGSFALVAGHAGSGILTGPSMAFSALLVIPSVAGLLVGYRIQDRLDADRFRRWTLVMMVFLGLNLLRRAVGL
ncbi:sulfite exporter TauE/SafE family protein [Roseibaca sp. Y0-43]|uniref:sulfite exporter TauE/SafE family protein n=1 Tax=Roseibaca sp. Y0-43 TaxID=2816854 RepID=UPI001D0C2B63|nr:sulfite exporter TauE/SafE family protein [Roseibaca sp. Y0-43]MCC1480037.1 sulfite exporter TauE/SafE family protein [Roseibaca sp. Y0-43]